MPSAGPSDAQTETRPSAPGGRRGYWIPGLIALAVLVLIAVAVGAGDLDHRAPHLLQGPDIASQIALGIQAQEQTVGAPNVHCPKTEPVRSGLRFQCAVWRDGNRVPVEVVELDQHGELSWHLGT